jgi:hypothetical protein
MRDVNDCIKCVKMRYERCVHFIGIIFLYGDPNKNINIQEDVKFHGLSEYVVTF